MIPFHTLLPPSPIVSDLFCLGSGILPEEGDYLVKKANVTTMLVGEHLWEASQEIADYVRAQPDSRSLQLLSISSDARGIPSTHATIDNALSVNPAGPGLIMFTSGTTGRPKGVILPRVLFNEVKDVGNDQVALNHRPCHWIGGARTSVDAILTGKTLVNIGEKRAESRAEAVIAVLEEYPITDAVFTPALLRWVKQIMMKGGNPMPAHVRAERGNPFKHLSSIKCAAGICEPSTISFLTSLTGLRFETIYGATEIGGLITMGHSEVKVIFHTCDLTWK